LPSVVRSRQAEDDLIEIWRYIARDNPDAADRLLDRIERVVELLARHPLMGAARPDLRKDLRYFVSGRYLILYRPIAGGVEVVRVVHGARYLPGLF
jgi:toxin ParE1/3/4